MLYLAQTIAAIHKHKEVRPCQEHLDQRRSLGRLRDRRPQGRQRRRPAGAAAAPRRRLLRGGQPLPAHGLSARQGQRQGLHPDLPLAPRALRPELRRHLRPVRRRRARLPGRAARRRACGSTWRRATTSARHQIKRLHDGLERDIRLVEAKAAIALLDRDGDPREPFRAGLLFGTRYRGAGWGQGLTMLTCFMNMLPHLEPR